MGRGKLPLKLIEKERARRVTCMKRKKGLVKKAYELSTLCDVRVCLIIYDSADSEVNTWPEQPQQVDRIVADYLSYKAKNPSAKRDLTISDFFNDRIKKLKQQNDKLLKRHDDDQPFPPLSDSRIEDFSDHDLLDLLDRLDAKIAAVRKLKADRAAIQCVAPHGSNADAKPWLLDQPSSSNESALLNVNGQYFAGFDQTTAFDLNACYRDYDKSSVIRSNNMNFPYYTNLLEGGGLLSDWYGSGFTVPDVSAASNDEVCGSNLMLQPYLNVAEPLPVPMQSSVPAGRGQLHYYSPAVSMEPPMYLANMRMMIGGGPAVESDHKFVAGTSSQDDVRNLYFETTDFGFGKAPAV